MDSELIREVAEQLAEASRVLENMSLDIELKEKIVEAARMCATCLESGGKILLVGNGGSAADAQHIAAEFVNYFNFDRPGLAALALTTDSSVLTSISNDSSFERVYSRQVQALGRQGDVLIAYSTSATSKNILNAITTSKSLGIKVIGLTGLNVGKFSDDCDVLLQTPSTSTAKIQEGHLVIGHILSGLVESMSFDRKK
jgi:D-sedoheptulose 7-phosphate isomerase